MKREEKKEERGGVRERKNVIRGKERWSRIQEGTGNGRNMRGKRGRKQIPVERDKETKEEGKEVGRRKSRVRRRQKRRNGKKERACKPRKE